jgi:hypothetical protein
MAANKHPLKGLHWATSAFMYNGNILTVYAQKNILKGLREGSLIGVSIPQQKDLIVVKVEQITKIDEYTDMCKGHGFRMTELNSDGKYDVKPLKPFDFNIPATEPSVQICWLKAAAREAFLNGIKTVQAPVKAPAIKVGPNEIVVTAKPRDNMNWITGTIAKGEDKFQFQIKQFDKGSEHGIKNGRISKLWMRKIEADGSGSGEAANYSRGWDTRPTGIAKELCNAIIKKFN